MANDAYDYGRRLLNTLFTKEEQKAHVLIESNKTTKPPLDKERVEILFGKG